MQITDRTLDRLLAQVQKPGRYVGGEWNSAQRAWESATVRLALGYPDTYEIGMSNLGLGILYDLVNRQPDLLVERIYAPWVDMIAVMRADGVPLFSLETHHTLDDFDVIGLSLQHELTFTNVLLMLDLAQIPLLAKDRGPEMPLIIAGGSCTYNPEPMADFIDAFVIGEGEDVLIELLECVRDHKARVEQPTAATRAELFERLAQIEGVYVPSLYEARYADDGFLAALEPTKQGVPTRVKKRIVASLGPALTKPILPTIETVHNRGMVEIQRGCSRGCRFCQAGVIYKPIRERPVEETLTAIDEIVANTGVGELALVSLSSSDYSGIQEVISRAMADHAEDGLSIALPSLRIDSFSVELAEMIQHTRKTGLTFAPEAGSQRLRDVINKGVTEDDLVAATEAAFKSGWNRIKLYFMIGLPTETDEDVSEIARLVRRIHTMGKQIRKRSIDVNVTISTFVPKPHTPFQWAPLCDRETVGHRQQILRDALHLRGIDLSWSDWDATWLEALLCRADRRLGRVILRAYRAGAWFDAWQEHFRPELWHTALAEEQIDDAAYTTRPRTQGEFVPWQMIDCGVSTAFLAREYEKATTAALSPDCRTQCHNCGILQSWNVDPTQRTQWRCP